MVITLNARLNPSYTTTVCISELWPHQRTTPPFPYLNTQKPYIGDMSYSDYTDAAERLFPFILRLIDPERVAGEAFHDYIDSMNELSWEFEDNNLGGRGGAYNIAQRVPTNRVIGTLSLLKCFSESMNDLPEPEHIILDALAGDGTITRLLHAMNVQIPTIVSADLSNFMVRACLAQKFPCIRQSASHSLFKESALDGVLIAYGSHHLNNSARRMATQEAYRTIKPGGKLVLHDFETGSPAADWFNKVVHPFSRTGHPHRHFSKNEMSSLLEQAHFREIHVFEMYDPFVLRGSSPESARRNALMHMYRMYDLVKISSDPDPALPCVETHVNDILGGIRVEQTGNCWTATIRRTALVAVGTK